MKRPTRIVAAGTAMALVLLASPAGGDGGMTRPLEGILGECSGIAKLPHKVTITLPEGEAESGWAADDKNKDYGLFVLLKGQDDDGDLRYLMHGFTQWGICEAGLSPSNDLCATLRDITGFVPPPASGC